MHVLNDEQKQNYFSMCQDLQNKLQTDPLFCQRHCSDQIQGGIEGEEV